MRAPWFVYFLELAAFVAALVLTGLAFGWVVAAVIWGSFVVMMAVVAWVRRSRDNANPS